MTMDTEGRTGPNARNVTAAQGAPYWAAGIATGIKPNGLRRRV